MGRAHPGHFWPPVPRGHAEADGAPELLRCGCVHVSTSKTRCRVPLVQALPVLVPPPPPVLVPLPPCKCHRHCQRRAHRLCCRCRHASLELRPNQHLGGWDTAGTAAAARAAPKLKPPALWGRGKGGGWELSVPICSSPPPSPPGQTRGRTVPSPPNEASPGTVLGSPGRGLLDSSKQGPGKPGPRSPAGSKPGARQSRRGEPPLPTAPPARGAGALVPHCGGRETHVASLRKCRRPHGTHLRTHLRVCPVFRPVLFLKDTTRVT